MKETLNGRVDDDTDELTKRVDKHNWVVERTYKLEERVNLLRNSREGRGPLCVLRKRRRK